MLTVITAVVNYDCRFLFVLLVPGTCTLHKGPSGVTRTSLYIAQSCRFYSTVCTIISNQSLKLLTSRRYIPKHSSDLSVRFVAQSS